MFTSNNWRAAISGTLLVTFLFFAITSALSPWGDSLFETIMGVPSPKTELLFQPQEIKDERWQVQLTLAQSEQVVIYENELAIIRISPIQYAAYQVQAQLKNQESVGSGKPISYPSLSELTQEANVQFQNGTSHYNEYRILIADILKSGIVTLHDKRSAKPVTSITIQDYVFTCGPLCGSGSWTFYLPDGTVFYEVDYLHF